MNKKQIAQKDAQDALLRILSKGSTLSFVLCNRSETGMTGYYRVFSVIDNKVDEVTNLVARASGYKMDKKGRLMCYDAHEVYVNLIYILFPIDTQTLPYDFHTHMNCYFHYKNLA